MDCIKDRWAVSRLLRDRNLLDFTPPYQREGGVWSLDKKQLFVDSLFNRYDIPKIYLHRVNQEIAGFQYAVVDGKQRISTIYSFVVDDFSLGSDFKYDGPTTENPPGPGQRYSDLLPAAQEIFREIQLDVVIIETNDDDEDEIEELFSRLNNGEKLTAAESRNAFGGKINELVRQLTGHPFFTNKLGFRDRRYHYREVACKLLLLEHHSNSVAAPGLWYRDLKKRHLDNFVKDYREMSDAEASRLLANTEGWLDKMSNIFEDQDIELSKQSYPQLQYLFLKTTLTLYGGRDLRTRLRSFLREFLAERQDNLQRPDDERDPELIEYGRLMQQGTNDAGSMRSRVEILTRRFLKRNPEVLLKDPRRAFSLEERWVLWHRSGKKCEQCGIALASIEDLDGDHIIWHVEGGPTSLANARALCVPCNRGTSL